MGKSPLFLLIFNHLAFWHPFTLFSAVNKRIELQAWDWTQIKAYCKGFPYLISFFVLDILKLILYELQINFMLISLAVWWRTQLILAPMLIIVVFNVMEWSRLFWKNFWYLSESVQFLMLNKTRVVPSLKIFLGYPGRGCFGQNFHKKSQNFFLLESALCWTLYREKIWSSASFHQISSKSMQQY